MNSILDQLVSLLSMETIEENLFRGASQDLGFRQLFGGQVLGQALSAASQTVDGERQANSLHMAISYVPVTPKNQWYTKLNAYVMVAALAPVASLQSKMVKLFSPAAPLFISKKKVFVTKLKCLMCPSLRT